MFKYNSHKEMLNHNTLTLLMLILLLSLTSCFKETQKSSHINEVNDSIKDNITDTNNTMDIININNLSKIDVSQWRNEESSSEFYRNNVKISKDEIILNESITYITDGLNLKNIEVSEVMLEPIKLTADYMGGNVSIIVNMDSFGSVKVSDIEDTIYKELSKYIPINTTLELGQEIGLKFDSLDEKCISVWFYPICYKLLYDDNEFTILKISNKTDDNNIVKAVSDGVYEIRFVVKP